MPDTKKSAPPITRTGRIGAWETMRDGELTEFFDLLDGFMAYDCGATDSGIKDDKRRAEAMAYLTSLDRDTRLLLIGRYLWHYDEEMGSEDEASTLEWFRDQGLL